MGGVRYPVDVAKLPYELRTNERLNPFFHCGLDLYVPIGSVSITPSRETLLYSDLTNQTIIDKLEEIIDEVVASIPTMRSEEHTSELQSLMRTSYAVFCLKKKTHNIHA